MAYLKGLADRRVSADMPEKARGYWGLEHQCDAGQPSLSPRGSLTVLSTDAGGSPAATHFLCFAKESKQRKATPLRRPVGVPKISRQQRTARKLVARGWFVAKGIRLCSPLKQCERTAPVAGAKFWRSNMGNSRARCFEWFNQSVDFQIITVTPGLTRGPVAFAPFRIPMPGVARRQVTFFCFAKRK
jgi:hypothetical protein